jgi:hypothetical protein
MSQIFKLKRMIHELEVTLAQKRKDMNHPYSDTRFTINEKGTDDIEEEGASKKNVSKKGSKTAATTTDD